MTLLYNADLHSLICRYDLIEMINKNKMTRLLFEDACMAEIRQDLELFCNNYGYDLTEIYLNSDQEQVEYIISIY